MSSSDGGSRDRLDESPAFIIKHDGVFYVTVAIMSHAPNGNALSRDHENTTRQLERLVTDNATSPAIAVGGTPLPAWPLLQIGRDFKLKVPPPPPGPPSSGTPATLEAVLPPVRIDPS